MAVNKYLFLFLAYYMEVLRKMPVKAKEFPFAEREIKTINCRCTILPDIELDEEKEETK